MANPGEINISDSPFIRASNYVRNYHNDLLRSPGENNPFFPSYFGGAPGSARAVTQFLPYWTQGMVQSIMERTPSLQELITQSWKRGEMRNYFRGLVPSVKSDYRRARLALSRYKEYLDMMNSPQGTGVYTPPEGAKMGGLGMALTERTLRGYENLPENRKWLNYYFASGR